jgi:hypothetical protein
VSPRRHAAKRLIDTGAIGTPVSIDHGSARQLRLETASICSHVHWRILVGKDAGRLDEAVRAKPNQAYDYAALFSQIAASASNTASTD